jgi:hypothetical protein
LCIQVMYQAVTWMNLQRSEYNTDTLVYIDSARREAPLERERERADEERARADRLEEKLREARLPWWRRMFGV